MRCKRISYRTLVIICLLLGSAVAAQAIAQTVGGAVARQITRDSFDAIAGRGAVDLVVVMKADRVLYLYDDGDIVGQFPIALGKNPIGTKRQRGDNRTPEGLYRLDWRNPDSIFHRSIHVSYPDARDVARARQRGVDPGDLIMIHGEPDYDDRKRTGDWTNGCIAVSNEAIDEIWSRVSNGTRIHIYP